MNLKYNMEAKKAAIFPLVFGVEDYSLSATLSYGAHFQGIDIATFGLSGLFKVPKIANTVNKTVINANTIIDWSAAGTSAGKVMYNEITNDKQK